MNAEQAVLILVPGANFRHPSQGFNRCNNFSDWDACTWDATANGAPKPTQAELEAVPVPAAELQAIALEALRQPVVVEGITFAVLRSDLGFYGAVNTARSEPETIYPFPMFGEDGVIIAEDAADVNRVYKAIHAAIALRASA